MYSEKDRNSAVPEIATAPNYAAMALCARDQAPDVSNLWPVAVAAALGNALGIAALPTLTALKRAAQASAVPVYWLAVKRTAVSRTS